VDAARLVGPGPLRVPAHPVTGKDTSILRLEDVGMGSHLNDRLTLNVTGTAESLDAEIDGDSGFDRCARTPNVEVSECEAPL
jgi:hypothetical protein